MNLSRTRFFLLTATLWVACFSASWAQFPDRPVRILVGAAAGGPTDIVARLISDNLSKGLGRAVIIENKAGAGGNIATQTLATAAPDGYTLLMGSFANAVNPAMMSVPYDTRRDLIPYGQKIKNAHPIRIKSRPPRSRAGCLGRVDRALRLPTLG